MNFDAWEPAYGAILDDLGYDRAADEAARDELAALVEPFDEARLEALFDGASVAVAAPGPSLADEVGVAGTADTVVAASSAANGLLAHGVEPDVQVTDLDGAPATGIELSRDGVVVAVHAHGDNRPALGRWVPEYDADQVVATTQAAPAGPVRNYGGFTDGDRGAFLADHFGADRLTFPGWDLDDPAVDDEKAHKLAWAARLLAWLEERRGERFGVLDGRRAALEGTWT